MPFNGSGSFSPPAADFPAVALTLIESAKFNSVVNDIATGLSTCITRDGQSPATANIPFGGFKLTGVGAGTARTDAANVGNVQDNAINTIASVAGTDTITGSLSPAITAYVKGMRFVLIPANDNTGAATLNLNGVGAKDLKKNTATAYAALAAGDLQAGQVYEVVYDDAGTDQFVVMNPSVAAFSGNMTVTGTLTVSTLTDGRLPIVGASGLVTDSASFSYTDSGTTKAITIGGSSTGTNVIHASNSGDGDAAVQLTAGGVTWFMAVDNSEAETLVISRSAIGNNYLEFFSTGDILLSNGQLRFPATQNPSSDANALDDYEEGTFTVTLTDGANNATMSDNDGRYVKIGRSVTIAIDVATSSLGSVSGDIRLDSLPFANSSGINSIFPGGEAGGLNITAGQNVVGRVGAASSVMNIRLWDASNGTTAMQATEWSADGSCSFSGTYIAAA